EKRTVAARLVRAAAAPPVPGLGPPPAGGFVPLFAGTLDPKLLKALPENKGSCGEVNGVLVVRGGRGGPKSGDPAHVVTVKDDYENFTLRVELDADETSHGLVVRHADGATFRYVVATGGLVRDRRYTAGTICKFRVGEPMKN